ncbi:MAG: ABC transporter ATP-binding protein [Spirochaetales bacterium]|nr:ABC transporter ATP-binding protein [Spirochaetales bacterium]
MTGERDPARPPGGGAPTGAVPRPAAPAATGDARRPLPARPAGLAAALAAEAPVLDVRNLAAWYFTDEGTVKAVDGVGFKIGKGKTLGLVGESGCGKTATGLAVLGLLPPPGRVVRGEAVLGRRDLLRMPEQDLAAMRGRDVSMIFQEPMSALDPLMTTGAQIAECLEMHTDLDRRQRAEKAVELLASVGVPEPALRAKAWPHELSGGMRQRVVIAMALACDPKVVIADEPTTALDVTVQAQILDLIEDTQERTGMGVVLVTHDLAAVAQAADEVAVMYAGVLVETGPVKDVFSRPAHPYTKALLGSIPVVGQADRQLVTIPGRVPNLARLPSGCRFADRCPLAEGACRVAEPDFIDVGAGRKVRCILATGRAAR